VAGTPLIEPLRREMLRRAVRLGSASKFYPDALGPINSLPYGANVLRSRNKAYALAARCGHQAGRAVLLRPTVRPLNLLVCARDEANSVTTAPAADAHAAGTANDRCRHHGFAGNARSHLGDAGELLVVAKATAQFFAEATYKDGTEQDVTPIATWTSRDIDVASEDLVRSRCIRPAPSG
jgi:hypothetical protein